LPPCARWWSLGRCGSAPAPHSRALPPPPPRAAHITKGGVGVSRTQSAAHTIPDRRASSHNICTCTRGRGAASRSALVCPFLLPRPPLTHPSPLPTCQAETDARVALRILDSSSAHEHPTSSQNHMDTATEAPPVHNHSLSSRVHVNGSTASTASSRPSPPACLTCARWSAAATSTPTC